MTLNHENPLRIGVLALQGDFREHAHALQRLNEVGGIEIVEVRLPVQLDRLDGIIIPGGESMTISKLMQDYGLLAPVKAFAKAGKVDSATIISDRMTGRSKGFGFVEMTEDEGADAAIEMWNGKDFGGRSLTVNVARPMTDRPKRQEGGDSWGGGR